MDGKHINEEVVANPDIELNKQISASQNDNDLLDQHGYKLARKASHNINIKAPAN